MKSGEVTIKGTARTKDGSPEGTPDEDKPRWTYVGDVDIALRDENGGAISEPGGQLPHDLRRRG